jgi:hypothetical protein
MDKRYTVFVSSTYEDLKEERSAVIQAMLELDCIPVGMEFFSAANEDQWTQIKELIDQCDYYVVLTAGKYGSTNEEGKSYTQLEYEYALERNVPTIGFVHKDLGQWPSSKVESNQSEKDKLLAFHELIKKKLCQFWLDKDDLKTQVTIQFS